MCIYIYIYVYIYTHPSMFRFFTRISICSNGTMSHVRNQPQHVLTKQQQTPIMTIDRVKCSPQAPNMCICVYFTTVNVHMCYFPNFTICIYQTNQTVNAHMFYAYTEHVHMLYFPNFTICVAFHVQVLH